jgi:hypothetical protein
MYTLLLPEGQTGEAREFSKKAAFFQKSGSVGKQKYFYFLVFTGFMGNAKPLNVP